MKTKIMVAMMTVAGAVSTSSAFAQNITDLGSVTTAGVSGSHDKVQTVKNHTPTTYGIFVDHGNKMTSTSGVIYDFGADFTHGKTDGNKYNDFGVQGQFGYRVSVADDVSVDALGGLEYGKFTIKTKDGDGVYKTPSVKAGVGANYFASQNTSLRAEVGYSYNFEGTLKDKSVGEDYDLKGAGNPYVELSVLNNSTGVPIFASVYHTKTTYKFDYSESTFKDSQSVTGLKVGVAF